MLLPTPRAFVVATERFTGPKLALVLELSEQASAFASRTPLRVSDSVLDVFRASTRHAREPFARWAAFERKGLPPALGDASLAHVAAALEADLLGPSQTLAAVRSGRLSRHDAAAALVAASAFPSHAVALAFLTENRPHA